MEQNISVAYRLFGASMLPPISTLDCKSPRKARSAKDWHYFADTKLSFCAIFPPGYVANVRFGAPPRRCPASANGRPPARPRQRAWRPVARAAPPASAPCPPELPLAGTAPLRAALISECGSPPQSPSASVPRDPRRSRQRARLPLGGFLPRASRHWPPGAGSLLAASREASPGPSSRPGSASSPHMREM